MSDKECLVEVCKSGNSNCSLKAAVSQRRRSLGKKPVADEVLMVNTPSSLEAHALPPFYRPTAVRVFPLSLAYSKGERPPSEV